MEKRRMDHDHDQVIADAVIADADREAEVSCAGALEVPATVASAIVSTGVTDIALLMWVRAERRKGRPENELTFGSFVRESGQKQVGFARGSRITRRP
jgi:hypothetical protein